MSTKHLKIGDQVAIGQDGVKGKVVDVYKTLGTYCMYSVRTYNGQVVKADKHELVKGMPDEQFNLETDLTTC